MNLINDLILKAMENSETKQQLEELDKEIKQLESSVEDLEIQLTLKKAKLQLRIHRKQSIINYLNE